eukprot:6311615-Prymnesium_polylepis.1
MSASVTAGINDLIAVGTEKKRQRPITLRIGMIDCVSAYSGIARAEKRWLPSAATSGREATRGPAPDIRGSSKAAALLTGSLGLTASADCRTMTGHGWLSRRASTSVRAPQTCGTFSPDYMY